MNKEVGLKKSWPVINQTGRGFGLKSRLRNDTKNFYYRVLAVFLLLIGCQPKTSPEEKYLYTQIKDLFGTTVKIDVCLTAAREPAAQEAFQELWPRLEDIHRRMNVFDEKSEVTKINTAYPQAVEVRADTYQLLKDAVYYYHWTEGAFDITVWPLIALWKTAVKKNILPTLAEIEEVKKSLSADRIEFLPNHQIRLNHPGTKIDLGGIGVGYAVDEAVRIFQRYGIFHFLIDAGGDMYAQGVNCQGQPWRIGIQDPFQKGKMREYIQLSNAAVTTSGKYARFYEIQGQRFSHIMDPRSGYPLKEVVSCTVIAPNTQIADVLATAFTVLGSEKTKELLERMDESIAVYILQGENDGAVHQWESQNFHEWRLSR